MNSLADQLPAEISRQIHPDWRKNEAAYWAKRDGLLAPYQGQAEAPESQESPRWRCIMTTANLVEEILNQVHDVQVRCPELRFGQLIATIGMLAEDQTGHSLWDVEDADFAAALGRFAADMARREMDRAEPPSAASGMS